MIYLRLIGAYVGTAVGVAWILAAVQRARRRRKWKHWRK